MVESGTATGRRERKKAATRKAIADAALRLFLEHGYDQVGIRDITEEADVSTTTLFKHFEGKEALVFDRESDIEAALLAAVRERPPGQSIPAALRDHALREGVHGENDPQLREFLDLVESTPRLREYHRNMWMRHADSLARVIAADRGLTADDAACAALAHFALDASHHAGTSADPELAVRRAFDLLESGWNTIDGG